MEDHAAEIVRRFELAPPPSKLYHPPRELAWESLEAGLDLGTARLYEGDHLGRWRYNFHFDAKADGGVRRGRPGLPWSFGDLLLEHHPKLRPLSARGLGSDPGEYWRLLAMPQVADWIEGVQAETLKEIHRLEPAEVPEHMADDPLAEALCKAQNLLCQHIWHDWTRTGAEHSFETWGSEVLLFALVCGFYLGEKRWCRRRIPALDAVCLMPELPELRAPWTVDEWVLQQERPVGVVQRLYHSRDNAGAARTQAVLPWPKLMHVAHLPAGASDLEGRSALRAAYTPLRALSGLYQIQALSVEINGVGTWVLFQTDPNAPPLDSPEVQKVVKHLKNYKAGHVPYIGLPHGWDIKLLTPQDQVPDLSPQHGIFEAAAERAMARSSKGIAQRQAGSFAARDSASKDDRQGAEWTARSLLHRPLERYLAQTLEMNFPRAWAMGYRFAPRIVAGEIAQRDPIERAQTLATYAGAGLITPTPATEEVLRDEEGLPGLHAQPATQPQGV